MPATPSSQPGITLPAPSGNENGCPWFQEASNSVPSFHSTPSYCTVTVWPVWAFGPFPFLMSLITSLVGGSPPGTVMCGLAPSLPVTLTAPGFPPPGASVGAAVGAAGGGSVACACGVASPSSEDEPHAANASTANSRGRASRYRRMAAAKGSASAERWPYAGGAATDTGGSVATGAASRKRSRGSIVARQRGQVSPRR